MSNTVFGQGSLRVVSAGKEEEGDVPAGRLSGREVCCGQYDFPEDLLKADGGRVLNKWSSFPEGLPEVAGSRVRREWNSLSEYTQGVLTCRSLKDRLRNPDFRFDDHYNCGEIGPGDVVKVPWWATRVEFEGKRGGKLDLSLSALLEEWQLRQLQEQCEREGVELIEPLQGIYRYVWDHFLGVVQNFSRSSRIVYKWTSITLNYYDLEELNVEARMLVEQVLGVFAEVKSNTTHYNAGWLDFSEHKYRVPDWVMNLTVATEGRELDFSCARALSVKLGRVSGVTIDSKRLRRVEFTESIGEGAKIVLPEGSIMKVDKPPLGVSRNEGVIDARLVQLEDEALGKPFRPTVVGLDCLRRLPGGGQVLLPRGHELAFMRDRYPTGVGYVVNILRVGQLDEAERQEFMAFVQEKSKSEPCKYFYDGDVSEPIYVPSWARRFKAGDVSSLVFMEEVDCVKIASLKERGSLVFSKAVENIEIKERKFCGTLVFPESYQESLRARLLEDLRVWAKRGGGTIEFSDERVESFRHGLRG